MNILILNLILGTAEKGVIPKRKSIKDTMIYNFAMGFVKNGHTVTLVASEEYRPTDEEEYNIDVVFMKSFLPKIFNPALLPLPLGLPNWLKKFKGSYDLVISRDAFSFTSLFASLITKEKLIIWQEIALHQKFLFRLPSKIWYNIITRNISKNTMIIPCSKSARNFIKAYSNTVSFETIDNGVNADLFKPSNFSADYFIIVSRLVPGKNINTIIKTFNKFIEDPKYSHYKLKIIGEGKEYNNIKNLINNLKLDQNIEMFGNLQHKEFCDILSHAKALLINTSKDHNMVSISESILSGTPVLLNSVPTNAYFVAENELGIVKDGWNENELKMMHENYQKYHNNCIEKSDFVSNTGCTKRMIEIFMSGK